ncbi:hypothetical protein BU23DRAFT_574576 [Bimuria novae-zelandiae CBS 107.79]|uniref:Uncharacterized protein n=1 Tax=Bimuria novae-zelandiae CBS 107.79 TaxID=1447943 RepID=A0A6A5UKR7_9PLEO|nr:hypothetical protein BU23DRAFT_574576 [Bimuria novae-zelandiae CBS 107.79]
MCDASCKKQLAVKGVVIGLVCTLVLIGIFYLKRHAIQNDFRKNPQNNSDAERDIELQHVPRRPNWESGYVPSRDVWAAAPHANSASVAPVYVPVDQPKVVKPERSFMEKIAEREATNGAKLNVMLRRGEVQLPPKVRQFVRGGGCEDGRGFVDVPLRG